MTIDGIPSGVSVFIDANPFIYHFTPHATLGPSSRRLMEHIARRQVVGITSAHVLTNVAHRMMTVEAMARFMWPAAGIASRLSKHQEIRNLNGHRQSLDEISTWLDSTRPASIVAFLFCSLSVNSLARPATGCFSVGH